MLLEKNDITYGNSETFSTKTDLLTHAFQGRLGGVSLPPYDSLNSSYRTGDDPEAVEKNLELSSKTFGFRKTNLLTVNQVHSGRVISVESPGKDYSNIQADAIITKQEWTPIAILTADCVPILLFDRATRAVGAVHAGWKGTVKGIASATVQAMKKKYGSDPARIMAAIGPAIGPCCYEVSTDVSDAFKDKFGSHSGISNKDRNTCSIDLKTANKVELQEAGLKAENIDILKQCTSCNNEIFFSYRKDNKETGRQLSFIMLKGPTPC